MIVGTQVQACDVQEQLPVATRSAISCALFIDAHPQRLGRSSRRR